MGQADVLLDAMLSVVERNSCCYVAGPITSGRALLLGADAADAEASCRASLAGFTSNLRGTLSIPVLNPGVLVVDGWTPAQHGDFFLRAMEVLAMEVRFCGEWQYSIGATKEYVRAREIGLPVLDFEGHELPVKLARELIEAARAAYDGIDDRRRDRLTARLASLTRLV